MASRTSVFTIYKNVNIPIAQDNQIRFRNLAEQTAFFAKASPFTSNNIHYQRTDSNITVDIDIMFEKALTYDYASYKNPNHNNKIYYCFIENLAYVNENVTRFYLKLDVYQTFLFDYSVRRSFVEREHGVANNVLEGLDYGDEYDIVSEEHITPYRTPDNIPLMFVQIVMSEAIGVDEKVFLHRANGLPTQLYHYIVPFLYPIGAGGTVGDILLDGGTRQLARISELIEHLTTSEKYVNKIVSVNIMPFLPSSVNWGSGTRSINVTELLPIPIPTMEGKHIYYVSTESNNTLSLYNRNKMSGFTNRNAKLMRYPYAFTEIMDYQGNSMIIKNEYIQGNNLQITCNTAYSIAQKHSLNVINYNKTGRSYLNSIINVNASDIPFINEQTAAFLQSSRNARETSLSNNILSATLGGAVSGGVSASMFGLGVGAPLGALAGATIGFATSAYNTVTQQMAQLADIENKADQVKNMGGNTYFDYSNDMWSLTVVKKQIKPEFAQRLEGYFKRYGYKKNEFKVPNETSNSDFNFVKTSNVIINGTFPHTYKNEIAEMYNRGITFWHNRKVGT